MRRHLALPHIHLAHGPAMAPPGAADRTRSAGKQVIADRLAVAGVLLLVLATAAVFVAYIVQQVPQWQTGQLTAFATLGPVVTQSAGAQAPAEAAGGGLAHLPLVLISTAVEIAIFVALGLYLRHDMNRKR